MTMKPKYCTHCRVSLIPRTMDDRIREYCPSCGKVFYRNPIPVASAVVLNDARQVLLVRRARDPKKGMWCLPIGFAELDETIEEAALRELREEAGVTGAVKHLLGVHSQKSDFYGDLLIVTFEIGDIAGTPRAGDDADDAAWFDLDGLPPLAFVANEKAISECMALHRLEWAQADSFRHLGDHRDHALLSARLVQVVEAHAAEIVKKWLCHVRDNPDTNSYRAIDSGQLQQRATAALQHLGGWLMNDVSPNEVRAFFEELGGERGAGGLDAHELVISLTYLRQTIWDFCRAAIDAADPVSTYAALELNQRIIHFFDLATVESSKAMTKGINSPG